MLLGTDEGSIDLQFVPIAKKSTRYWGASAVTTIGVVENK